MSPVPSLASSPHQDVVKFGDKMGEGPLPFM